MEDSDGEIGVSKKRKKATIESSSDDDEPSTNCTKSSEQSHSTNTPGQTYEEECTESSSARSSTRIAKRRSRSFEMPTRDSVWKKITPTKHAEKYQELAPRKLVNNFTKENSRYNYDPNYTSGEESWEEFIDDSDLSMNSNSDTEETKPCKKGAKARVKNYKKRVVIESSSESDTESEEKSRKSGNSETGRRNIDKCTKKSYKRKNEIKSSKTICDNTMQTKQDEERHSNESGFEDCMNKTEIKMDEDGELLSPCRRRCRSNVIESDSESDSTTSEKVKTGKNNKHFTKTEKPNLESLETPETETFESDKQVNNAEKGATEIVGNNPENDDDDDDNDDDGDGDSNSNNDIDGDGESESNSDSNDEDSENVTRKRRVQMIKKKKEKLKLFEKIRQERERKLSREKKKCATELGS